MIEAYISCTHIDCACSDDLLPYAPFTTATGNVMKVVYNNTYIVPVKSLFVSLKLYCYPKYVLAANCACSFNFKPFELFLKLLNFQILYS